jgi:hypothetical protein
MSVQRGLLWRLVTLGALILGVFLAGACGLARAEEPRVTACTVAKLHRQRQAKRHQRKHPAGSPIDR